jgi:hypothetical protein
MKFRLGSKSGEQVPAPDQALEDSLGMHPASSRFATKHDDPNHRVIVPLRVFMTCSCSPGERARS